MNSTPSEKDKKVIKVVPFKLCFVAKKEPGRSNIQIGKPLNYGNYLIFGQTYVI